MAKDKEKIEEEKPLWLKFSKEEVDSLIIKLAKENVSSEKIGLVLRDVYGIPSSKKISEKISKIMKKNNLYGKPIDIINLIKRINNIKKHLEKNKQDKKAKRGMQLTEAKINKLAKYYKKKGVLLKNWEYRSEKI